MQPLAAFPLQVPGTFTPGWTFFVSPSIMFSSILPVDVCLGPQNLKHVSECERVWADGMADNKLNGAHPKHCVQGPIKPLTARGKTCQTGRKRNNTLKKSGFLIITF